MPGDVQRQIDELRDTVFGNGSEGLKVRMIKTELLVADLVEARKEQKRWLMGIASAVIVALLLAVGAQLWQSAKIQATNEIIKQAARQLNVVAQEVAPDAALPAAPGE